MDDSFTFGAPAKRPAKLGSPRRPGPGRSSVRAWLLVAVGLVVAAIVLFVALRRVDGSGDRAGDGRPESVTAIDRANDAAAQGLLGRAVVAARTAWADAGAFPSDPTALAALDPGATFTEGASTGPEVVAIDADATTFAAAVRSRSGTCWWVTLDGAGTTAYGSGDPCTGEAARSADALSW